MRKRLTTCLIACTWAACARPPEPTGTAESATVATVAAAGQTNGSAGSDRIATALERFREGARDSPATLGAGAAASRDMLIRRFVDALERADTAAFASMVLNRAEFVSLYYPETRYTRPPYAIEPDVLWFLMVQNTEKGIGRALRSYGGRSIGFRGYRCNAEPDTVGSNRLWDGCVLVLDAPRGAVMKRLFGAVLERDGRFKFLSLANDL